MFNCWYIQFEPIQISNNVFVPNFPLFRCSMNFFCPNSSSRTHFGGTNSSWPADHFNHITRSGIAGLSNKCVQIPGLLAGGSDECFTWEPLHLYFIAGLHCRAFTSCIFFSPSPLIGFSKVIYCNVQLSPLTSNVLHLPLWLANTDPTQKSHFNSLSPGHFSFIRIYCIEHWYNDPSHPNLGNCG